MERLKVAIADKILEISSGNPEEIKFKLGKVQRFSDFAEACKTLMTKYPEIETELLEMVRDNDFDASHASRRVDSIITPPPAVTSENDVSVTENETSFEEILAAENEVFFSTIPEESAEDGDKKAKRKKQLTLLWQVLAVAVAIFVVVIVVKFVVSYWKIILIVLGSLLAIYLLWIFLKRRNRNKIN